jgi:DNA-binding MarR family transcriptional regulator
MDPAAYLFHLQLYSTRCRNVRLDTVVSPFDLNLARYRTLFIIDWFQPCTMRELADFSLSDRTTMTRTVDGLVEAGWVDRSRSPDDRREVIVTLTPAGAAKMREGNPAVWAMNREAMAGISEEEQRELIRLSQKVFANLAPDTPTRERVLRLKRRGEEVPE